MSLVMWKPSLEVLIDTNNIINDFMENKVIRAKSGHMVNFNSLSTSVVCW